MNKSAPKSGEPAWLFAMPPDEFNVFKKRDVSSWLLQWRGIYGCGIIHARRNL